MNPALSLDRITAALQGQDMAELSEALDAELTVPTVRPPVSPEVSA